MSNILTISLAFILISFLSWIGSSLYILLMVFLSIPKISPAT